MAKDIRIIECRHCEEEVKLSNSWSNTCSCGCEYNGAGQLLVPRWAWGEETGERFD